MTSKPSLKRILGAANVYFGFDVGIKSRKRELVIPRQITHYVAHKIYGHSLKLTGEQMGGVDHSTVLNSCKVITNQMSVYPKVRDDVRRLNAKCRSKELLDTPDEVLMDLLKYSEASPVVKIGIRYALKLMRDEGI